MISCADYHLSDLDANIIQLLKLPSCVSILTKINILTDNSKYTNIKRNIHVKCISLCICYSIV